MTNQEYRRDIGTGGGAYVEGRVYASEFVGRDKHTHIHQRQHYKLGVAGRIVISLGVLTQVVGFALFCYPVLDFILTIFNSMDSPGEPDMSGVEFSPYLPLGMALGVVGTVLMFAGLLFIRRARPARQRNYR